MTTKDLLSWAAKNIVLPLLPTLIGSSIRIISSGEVNKDTFETGELAFSMAMLTIFAMASASRLTDKSLRDSLLILFTVVTAFFLVLFGWASLLKVQLELGASEALVQLRALTRTDTVPAISIAAILNDKHSTNYMVMLGRIKLCVVLLSVVVVPVTILCKVKFKLED